MRGRLVCPERSHCPFLDTLPYPSNPTLPPQACSGSKACAHLCSTTILTRKTISPHGAVAQGASSNQFFADSLHYRYGRIRSHDSCITSPTRRPYLAPIALTLRRVTLFLPSSSHSCTRRSQVSECNLPASLLSTVDMDIEQTDNISKNRKNYHPPDRTGTQGLDLSR